MELDLTIYRIARIHRKANRFLAARLKAKGLGALSPSHGDIMLALFQHRQLTMKRLAALIDRDKSTVTALVGKLEGLGYVQRYPDPLDSRISLVSLTDAGAALRTDFEAISRQLYQRAFPGLSAADRKILAGLLARVDNNL